jgi:hypothetical protein
MPTKLPKAACQKSFVRLCAGLDRGTGHRSAARELRAPGCAAVLEEYASGADRSRPVLACLLIRPGETLVVVRRDRLARSVSHLLAVIGAGRRRPNRTGAVAGGNPGLRRLGFMSS